MLTRDTSLEELRVSIKCGFLPPRREGGYDGEGGEIKPQTILNFPPLPPLSWPVIMTRNVVIVEIQKPTGEAQLAIC